MKYIVLDEKTPTHKFKNGEGAMSWDEAKDFDNVAVLVPKGYVVLDFDTDSDAEIMMNIITGLDLKCRVMKTTRGIHVWFKCSEENPKNFIKSRLAVGIYCDRKTNNNGYVKIKQDGAMREIIRKVKGSEIMELPKWLYAVSAPSDKFKFKEMTEGSGRNQELFNYIVYLQTKGFKRDEIRETIKIINDYVFTDPLDDSEIDTICRDEAFKPDDVIDEQIQKAKKSGFNHIEIADIVTEKHRLIRYNGIIYEYDNGYYRPVENIRQYIRDEYYGIKNNQVNEVLSYISDMYCIRHDDVKIDPYIINLNNTRYNIRTGQCLPFDPEVIEFNRIPVNYDPSAYCADIDKMLNKVFLSDRDVIDLFEELLGYTLIRHARYQKGFIFVGSGSNGKSTVMDLMKTFYGHDNYSAIPLEKVTDRFSTAQLENMYCNIGDDIDNINIRDAGTIKKLLSGDALQVERKGETPYTAELTATHIYSANELPRSYDKSKGFYRRFIIIPFNASFTPDDEDYDPMIVDKITTPEALSYLLNVALRGAKRLMKNGKFTNSEAVNKMIDQYVKSNSSALTWVDDEGITDDYCLTKHKKMLYAEYSDYCKTSGLKVVSAKTFYKDIGTYFDFETKQKGDGERYFVVKI